MASRLKEDERNERTIRNLLKLPENRRCINCNSLGPQYVCTSFWTFVCTTCSGIHREFTHRVKSVSMAKFTTQEVSALQGGGNASAKEIYLKEWDTQRQSLPDSSNVERLRDFIKHVYVDRRYSGERSFDKPPRSKTGETEDTYGSRSPPYETDRRYTNRPSPGGRILHRTASSSSLASSNGNPNPNPATELRRESSLIDFDTDPEPSVPIVAQSGGSSFSDNWASFDSNPMEPSMVRRSKRRNTGPGAGTGTPPVFDTEALEALIAERVAAAIALYESQRADGSDPGDSTGGSGGNPRPCSYKHFMNCKPQSFFGNGGVIELTRWFEKTESVFQISSCALGDQVKYAACTFANTALTWWNGHVQTIGIIATNSMSWDELKAMMLEEYCPRSEVQNLEQEFWNLTMKDSEIQAYTTRFTELAILCPRMVTPVDKKIERYIWGLAPQIQSLVTAARPVTFESAKSIAVRLTDQGIRHGTMVQRADPPFGESNKRKSWEISHNEEGGSEFGSEEYDESDSGSEEFDEHVFHL